MKTISLKAARVNAGYTTRQMAELLGMTSPQAISKYECGLSEPTVCTALKMCELYDVSIYDIEWIEKPNAKRGNPRKKKTKEVAQ